MVSLMSDTWDTLSHHPELPIAKAAGRDTVSTVLIEALRSIGLRRAFGIAGTVLPFHDALCRSQLEVVHFRHESGAIYAAIEASLAEDLPVLVFTTSFAGLTAGLNAAMTARSEGAKLLLVSAVARTYTPGLFAGRSQYTPHASFDYALALDDPQALPQIITTLTEGLANPRGFVAQLALPTAIGASPAPGLWCTSPRVEVTPSSRTIDAVVESLGSRFAVWVGYGARHAADRIAELVGRTSAPIFSTPRGRGISDENDPRFLGVSGLDEDAEIAGRLVAAGVHRVLVLGSQLGRRSSGHDPALVPADGLVHVDLDPAVPGWAYPHANTLAVRSEIATFLDALLERCDELGEGRKSAVRPRPLPARLDPRQQHRIRPRYLMQCMQERVVENTDAVVLSETGTSIPPIDRDLRFAEPNRYRMSSMLHPMGHVSAGVLGTAATGRRAVAIVHHAAFLMQNELSTAAAIGADVIWIVLNDARRGTYDRDLRVVGTPTDLQFPEVDFSALARSMGVEGVRVSREDQVSDALDRVLCTKGPFVLEVLIESSSASHG
jgi:acetolactate synthase I/II/III large subunit